MTHENEQETSPLIFSGFEPGLNAQHELVMTLNRYFFISSRGQTENHPMVSQDSSRRVELAQSCFVKMHLLLQFFPLRSSEENLEAAATRLSL